MLKHLRLRNFKAWQDTGDLRLAPITILFGNNSAGKSSIPQLLLLLKQTADSSDRRNTLHFGDDRTPVDLGDLLTVAHEHDLDNHLEFELEWDLPKPLAITDAAVPEFKYETSSILFEATISGENESVQPTVKQMQYTLNSQGKEPLRLGMEKKKSAQYKLTHTKFKAIRNPGRGWPLPPPFHYFGFPDEAVAYYQNTGFVADLGLEMNRLLESIKYVGPLREHPRRLYKWSGETPSHVGNKGERSIEALLAGKDREFNLRFRQRYKQLHIVVAEQLKRMGMIDGFRVEPVAPGRKEYEVRIVVSPGSSEVLLTDVGFGVSQVLPVIVECFYVAPESIVIFEQPEIHLHPAVQARLADLFIDAINSNERVGGNTYRKRKRRGKQFIIESHSEHFLRRLQRRIAEEKLSAEDAALYFIEMRNGKAEIRELEIDQYGRIRDWPDEFFGDAVGETEAQMDAMLNRMTRIGNKDRSNVG